MDFTEFPKMARWSRDVIVTEKIDGTNAQIYITSFDDNAIGMTTSLYESDGLLVFAGSRTRWITPQDDNYGFAAWVRENGSELLKLGMGRHFGEWWGRGIQRNYSMTERRFSLFNVSRWYAPSDCAGEGIDGRTPAPACCGVVPILAKGPNHPGVAEATLKLLRERGSFAAPGFMDPEGIVIWHTAANIGFKKTIHKDEMPKSLAAKAA